MIHQISGSRADAGVPVDISLLLIGVLSAVAGGRHNLLSVQRKRVGEDLIRDMALEKEYDPPRMADSHQNRPKAGGFVDLLGALALKTRAGLDGWNREPEWWRRVECAVQIVGVHSRGSDSDNDHSCVDNVGLGTGGS